MIAALHWLGGHWIALLVVVALVAVLLSPAGAPVLEFLFGTRIGIAILAALAIAGACLIADGRGYARGLAERDAQARAADLRASESAREAEAARAGVFHSNEVAYERGRQAGEARAAAVSADVGAHHYRLRHELECPRPAAPAAAQAGGPVDAAAATGILPDATVQDLVRLAGDADGMRDRAELAERSLDACLAARPVTP